MILVTGGTGLVGAHLLLHLTANNNKIRAIYRFERNTEKTKNLFRLFQKEHLLERIEWVEADILDVPALDKAMLNITQIYHCAALVSFDAKDEDALRKTNIEGTANVVNCALHSKVNKLCYVSSIAALGNPILPHTPITETTDWNPEKLHSDYAITKYGAEMEVWRGFYEGLSCVIVNPGVILGAGFWDQGSGEIISKTARGLTFYTKGTTGFVAVEDVVTAMQKLMDSEISGEKFVLVGENISFENFLSRLAQKLNVRKPFIYARSWMTRIAYQLDWCVATIFFTKRKLPKSLAKSLHTEELFSSDKIKTALDFEFTSIDNCLTQISSLYRQKA